MVEWIDGERSAISTAAAWEAAVTLPWTFMRREVLSFPLGAYVPLVAMYPKADVPTLQVSLPSLDPTELFSLGRRLAPLRDEGVLIVGSGFLTHNVRAMDFGPEPQTPPWASEFDAWAKDALERKDVDALLDYRRRAPGVRLALPTPA